jgi:hypothetical protein
MMKTFNKNKNKNKNRNRLTATKLLFFNKERINKNGQNVFFPHDAFQKMVEKKLFFNKNINETCSDICPNDTWQNDTHQCSAE